MSIIEKRKNKKIAVILCAAVMVSILAACGSTDTGENKSSSSVNAIEVKDYSNQTVTGKVMAIDGTQVTLQLGEMNSQNMKDNLRMNGDNGKEPKDGQQAPDKSDGGRQYEDQNPSGDASEIHSREDQPDSGENGERKGNAGFTPGDETLSIDLDGVSIVMDNKGDSVEATFDDISQDDILKITFGENSTAETVTIRTGNNAGDLSETGKEDTVGAE